MPKESELSKFKKSITKEEVKLAGEFKKEGRSALWFFKSHTFRLFLAIIIFIILIFATIYIGNSSGKIYIENSVVSAPVISLASANAGVLEKILVSTGQKIQAGMIVAQVNGNPIKAQIDGLVIFVQNTPGQIVNAQIPIVQMIDPSEFRVIGHIEEDKGLKDIVVGQKVLFTVDAFPGKKYYGVVDSISPTARSSDIVFSISDKRQEQQFDVNVKFNIDSYPELKNGMSAKMWIYK
jgi:multidrug resistance efflux pump